jgi:hypothetical protein
LRCVTPSACLDSHEYNPLFMPLAAPGTMALLSEFQRVVANVWSS